MAQAAPTIPAPMITTCMVVSVIAGLAGWVDYFAEGGNWRDSSISFRRIGSFWSIAAR